MELGGLSFLDRPVFGLSDGELFTSLKAIVEAERRLAAARLEMIREITGRRLHHKRGFASPGAWLNKEFKICQPAAGAMASLTKSLNDLPGLADALAKGVVSEDQAKVIAHAIADIRKDASPAEQRAATERLIEQAAFCTPEDLKRAGHRVMEHVAPDAEEERERKKVLDNERAGHETRFLTLTNDSSGRVQVKGWLTLEAAAIFRAVLDPLCNPARLRDSVQPGEATLPDTGMPSSAGLAADTGTLSRTARKPDPASPFGLPTDWQQHTAPPAFAGNSMGDGGTAGTRAPGNPDSGNSSDTHGHQSGPDGPVGNAFRDHRTPGQRRHDALVEMCELLLKTGDLPENGGSKPQLTLTIPYDVLRKELKSGTLDTGERLSAETVRRLACDAGIIPAILDGHGVPLDLGRERRLISGALRRALVLRDKGCIFPGCDRPPRWCQGHHVTHWEDGGDTKLADSALVCGFHHRLIHHDSGWEIRFAKDGHPEVLPPAWMDPDRRAQRNFYWHRE
jgi:hypothetical protein